MIYTLAITTIVGGAILVKNLWNYKFNETMFDYMDNVSVRDEYELFFSTHVVTPSEEFSRRKAKREEIKSDSLLSPDELDEINQLSGLFTGFNIPLVPGLKNQLKAFTALSMQYQQLLKKLQTLQEAMEFEDELIPGTEVENPILLVKQYQEKDHWHAVPASSYITDYDHIMEWFLRSPKHPLLNDNILKPDSYNGMPTQYVWHELNDEYCWAQELLEGAVTLRGKLQELKGQLSTIRKNRVQVSDLPETFFRSRSVEPAVDDIFSENTARVGNCCII